MEINKEGEVMNDMPTCPKCGGTMVARDGRNGRFYGCANFPKCRGSTDWKTWEKRNDPDPDGDMAGFYDTYLWECGDR